MAKIKLGDRPKTFAPAHIKFTMPDGTPGIIEAVYKYRTRVEFGKFMNDIFVQAGEKPGDEKPADDKVDFQKIFEQMGDKNTDHLLACLDSWNIDAPLNRDTLLQLSNELPAASVALMSGYRDACVEGRLGN